MKNKKTKILSVIFIGLFCMLIGFPFVNCESQTKDLLPNQYWALGTTLQIGDTLNFVIEAEWDINIYIMNQEQLDFYQDNPQDEADYYIGREWWHYTFLRYSFVAENNQQYYVLMINPSDSMSTYVTIDASVDEYIPKTITITNPTSTDTFDVGDVYITWTSTGDIDYVKIELYKNGAFFTTITWTTSNDGSYNWYIYNYDDYADGSNYQIKITDYSDDSIYDYSDYFSIEVEPYPNSYEPNYFLERLFWWLLIILVPIGIVIAVILIRRYKKKASKEPTIQIREVPKNIYCSECGIKITDMTKDYCSQCGSKIIFK